jgi:hypothetical protein
VGNYIDSLNSLMKKEARMTMYRGREREREMERK